MAKLKAKIILYLDLVSPFAYMAYYLTRNSPIFADCEITYVPILLGGLMKACDNQPPIHIKNKSTYLNLDRNRLATKLSIPIHPTLPIGFPPNTTSAMRALCVLSTLSPPSLLPLGLDALYTAFWGPPSQSNNITNVSTLATPAGFGPILASALGEEIADTVLERFDAQEARDMLKRNTQQAFGAGAFGVPWWECDDGESGRKEMFWGVDRVDMVVGYLGLREGEVKMDVERIDRAPRKVKSLL